MMPYYLTSLDAAAMLTDLLLYFLTIFGIVAAVGFVLEIFFPKDPP